MKKYVIFALTLAVGLAATAAVWAHTPGTNDCDTGSRRNHVPASPTPTPASHDYESGMIKRDSTHDVLPAPLGPDVAFPNQTRVLQDPNGGRYIVKTGQGASPTYSPAPNGGLSGYVEVVGGKQFENNPPYNNLGQGGYVQGRVDVAGHEADFHVASYGPISEVAPNLWHVTRAQACASVDNTKVGQTVDVPCPQVLKPFLPSQVTCPATP